MLGIGKSTSEKPQKSSRIRTAAGALALTASLAGVGIGAKQMAELPKDTQPRVEVSLVPAVSAAKNPETEPAAPTTTAEVAIIDSASQLNPDVQAQADVGASSAIQGRLPDGTAGPVQVIETTGS